MCAIATEMIAAAAIARAFETPHDSRAHPGNIQEIEESHVIVRPKSSVSAVSRAPSRNIGLTIDARATVAASNRPQPGGRKPGRLQHAPNKSRRIRRASTAVILAPQVLT